LHGRSPDKSLQRAGSQQVRSHRPGSLPAEIALLPLTLALVANALDLDSFAIRAEPEHYTARQEHPCLVTTGFTMFPRDR